MKFKNRSIYNLFIFCIQCFILICVGQNNHMDIYVDCNTVPYENYKCGGNNYSSTNPPCKSLEDAQQVSINLYYEWYRINYRELSLTIFISPCTYVSNRKLSFLLYTTVEIKNISNESFGKVIIVGPGIRNEINFLEIEEANEIIKFSGMVFKNWRSDSDILSLTKDTLKSKSIYLEYCIFDNTKVIFNSDYSNPKNFSIIGSNFKIINSAALHTPILKMKNTNFTMVNVNVTNCALNEKQPFIDLINSVSGITLSEITFQGNQMGSFLHIDQGRSFIANNLQFIENTIKLFEFDSNGNGLSEDNGKYRGFINLFRFGLFESFLNGFKFQNNTINSPAYSSLNSIIQISGSATFNISKVDISNNSIHNIHLLNVECSDNIPKESNIINIINSRIITDYLIGGYNFVSFFINTILDVNFKFDCSDCIYSIDSKETIIPPQTIKPSQEISSTSISSQHISTKSILIIILISVVVGSLLIFLIIILIRRNNYKKKEESDYISLDQLEVKPSINNGDEELLLQEEEEEASCDNDDVDQSTPNIYYKQDYENDNDYVNPGRIIVTQIKIPINNNKNN